MRKWIKLAVGKLAVGKLAVGRLAVGRLAVGRLTIGILAIGVLAVSGLLLFGTGLTIYGVPQGIQKQAIQDPVKPENKRAIGENVLQDTGLTQRYDVSEIRNISIYHGNIDGENGEDIIIALEFGPTDTLVVAYKGVANGYEYLGTVNTFFTVEEIRLEPAEKLNRDLVIVTEHANQRIGAFENSTLIRGYVWNGTQFESILQIPQGIKTQWNRLWESDNPNGPSRWEQIDMTSDITWENPKKPSIYLTEYQRYGVSTDTISRTIPKEETFVPEKERVVTQTLRWSYEWKRFILFEMIEKATGKKVAVIEDTDASPYALLSEFSQYTNKFQIVRDDGTRDFVSKDALASIDGSEKKVVFKSLP